MQSIEIFSNNEFGQVRTITIKNEPWFIGKDVADALGYERATKAVNDHVDQEDIDEVPIRDSIGRMQNTPIINESGLYSLIIGSKLDSAKRFKQWVTSEVLPSIRKHGMYATENTIETMLNDPDTMIKTLQALKDERQARVAAEKTVEEMKPKALFADCVSTSSSTIIIRDLAKILKQKGVDTGEKRLFEWMRTNKYLISRPGADYNSPTQKSMDMGIMELNETVIAHSDGHTSIKTTPKVTGKGQIYFINKFLNKEAI